MHDVVIFRPTKSAMQSGRLHRDIWNLVFQTATKGTVDPCMHWTSQHDTCQEVILRFQNRESAIAYAKRQKLSYIVQDTPPVPPMHLHTYSEHLLKPHLRS